MIPSVHPIVHPIWDIYSHLQKLFQVSIQFLQIQVQPPQLLHLPRHFGHAGDHAACGGAGHPGDSLEEAPVMALEVVAMLGGTQVDQLTQG
jgi:hypothetical protein